MKFRAAVLNKVNEPMTLDMLEMAALAPADVLVRIKASGLCHTDLEVIQGSLAYPLPIVLGHEGAGIVGAVGSDVTRVKSGDHPGTRIADTASTASATCRSCASRSPAIEAFLNRVIRDFLEKV